MGLRKIKILIGICVLFLICSIAVSSWQGPQTVIEGGWGNQPNEFGIEHGDSGDTFPRDIIVLSNNDIWIPDGWVNERLKLYEGNGNLIKIISLDKTTRTFPEYWFIGKFAAIGSDGSVYMSDYMGKKMYAQYSPTGQLIKTSTEKPAELGRVKSDRLGEKNYKIVITYPDKTFGISSDRKYSSYVKGTTGHVYGVNAGGVWRFNQCGKLEGTVLMPGSQTSQMPRQGGLEPIVTVNAEYGKPVVAPNGDVYTWKRTPDKYSILKWAWVDDPNVPTGPDAPTGLTLLPSTTGLYLTWTASPSDPGCVTGYEVARATSAGGVGSTVATVNAGTIKYNDTTATAGTTYYYKVRAKAGSEYSPYTTEVSGKR